MVMTIILACNNNIVDGFQSQQQRPQRHSFSPSSRSSRQLKHQRRRRDGHPCFPSSSLLFLSQDENNNDSNNNNNNLVTDLEGIQEAISMKDTVEVGDTIICKVDLPNQGFIINEPYRVEAIYVQRFNTETQTIEKYQLNNLNSIIPLDYNNQQQIYVSLYNPKFQSSPQIVTPQEIGLTNIKSEIIDSIWLAIPGFFWLFLCISFYTYYHERTGGSFMDAIFGRL